MIFFKYKINELYELNRKTQLQIELLKEQLNNYNEKDIRKSNGGKYNTWTDEVCEDKASGKDTERPEFQKMLDYVREGDTVYFESFSRISRSLPDLLNILDFFAKKGASFVSLKENIDTTGATGKLIVSVLGAISAYEREINAERREYGYKKALDEKRVGRPKAVANQAFHDAVKLWRDGKITATEAIKQAGMTRTTFYKLVKAERGQA